MDRWLNQTGTEYHSVNVRTQEKSVSNKKLEAMGAEEWTDERYMHIIKLKEEALEHARKMLADYIFVSL